MWWSELMTSRAHLTRRLPALTAVAGACALAACAHDGAPSLTDTQAKALTPIEQYPLRANEAPVELALAAHSTGLSPNQRTMLSDFARRWREAGGGPVLVRAPDSAGPESQVARQAADALLVAGVPRSAIRLGGYPEPHANAPVVVSFMGYQAEIADCSNQWGNLMSTGSNRVRANFGCSVHANMSAQIADPHDIVEPRPLDPGDGSRRADVLAKYRQGKKTSTERDDQARGTLSSVAQ